MCVCLCVCSSSTENKEAPAGDDPALQYLLSMCSPLSALIALAKPRVPAEQLRVSARAARLPAPFRVGEAQGQQEEWISVALEAFG